MQHSLANLRTIERVSRAERREIDFDVFKRKSWPGLTAEFARLSTPSEYAFRFNGSSDALLLLDLRRADGETTMSGVPRSARKDLRNRMTFVPSGCELDGWSKITTAASVTAVYYDRQVLNDKRCKPRSLPPLLEFEDNMLRAAMLQFQSLLHDPALEQPGYAETLGLLLAYEIDRLQGQRQQPSPAQGGLTPRQLRIVMDYLESRLNDTTTISDMAALVNLSRYYFIRAFKKAVGQSPHQFIMRRRIDRARELLTDHQLSVTEIAARSGFSSNAHLTRTFRQIVGTTPSIYRRET